MKTYNHLSREQRYTIDRLLKSKVSPILSLQEPLEWPLVPSLERFVGIKLFAEKFVSAGSDIRLRTQRMALLSAQIHLEDATRSIKLLTVPSRPTLKFTSKMRHEVEQIIRQQQGSSEQIVGRFRLEGIPIVGKTTLYPFLHKDKEGGGDLYRHTRLHLKYRHKPLASPQKGKWGWRKSIDERPDCIDRKERFGDFEMDLIIGAQQREAILTLTERKTGYAIIEKLPNGKNAKSLARVVNRSLAYFKRMGLLHSITTDNGSEFMAFRSIERALRVPVSFAKPYPIVPC